MLRTKTVMGLLLIGVFAGLVLTSTGAAWAQNQTDVFWVAYFNEGTNTSIDGNVHIVNPGVNGDTFADIYVFDARQEFKECCTCFVSADGILELSLRGLTNNPWNGVPVTTGVIKIVSDPAADPDSPTPTPELRSWITNINNVVTEERFVPTPLAPNELAELSIACHTLPNQTGAGSCANANPQFCFFN